ncbi:MAG: hypothetical protein KME20_21625 [Kaiparowitsia implicata GSE-PSE-MK54-09C]|jgi:hypothetical protein|nr:hypothetical protein [Kaiparowitsia implicata GSE-PSE-MK54-09C]
MIRFTPRKPVALVSVLERITQSKQMSRKDHLILTSALLSSQQVGDDLRRQINRILDELRTGHLKLVD